MFTRKEYERLRIETETSYYSERRNITTLRANCIKLINNSPIFGIDKEKDYTAFENEGMKLIGILSIYYSIIYGNNLDNVLLINKAKEAFNNYNSEKGTFLNYYNNIFCRAMRNVLWEESVRNMRGGGTLSNTDSTNERLSKREKLIEKVKKTTKEVMMLAGLDYDSQSKIIDKRMNPEIVKEVAKTLELKPEKVYEMLVMDENSIAISSTIINEEGEEIELFDLQASHEKTEEDRNIDELSFIERVEKMDKVFDDLQDREKRVHSMIFTSWIIRFCDGDLDKAREFLSNKEYLNEEIFRFLEDNGECPNQKEIANLCGKKQEDISRVLGKIYKKLFGERWKKVYVKRSKEDKRKS